MKLFVYALVVALGCGLGASGAEKKKGKKGSPEQTFTKLDINNDKKLSAEEFVASAKGDAEKKAKAEKKFGKLDKNGDGSLTLEEYSAPSKKKK